MLVQLGWAYDAELGTSGQPPLKVLVDPTLFIPESKDWTIIHEQANGATIDRPIGWFERITMTISEDVLQARVKVNGVNTTARELVNSWRRAKHRWIQNDLVNSGNWVKVSFAEVPKETPVESTPDWKEISFILNAELFHINRNE